MEAHYYSDSLDIRHPLGLRYRFSPYDSMIVASALLGECTTLYSEDLQHHQRIDNQPTIINPFEVAG